MPITLYGGWSSTFARKVALGRELKPLAYEAVDIEWLLSRGFHDGLVEEIRAGRAAFPE